MKTKLVLEEQVRQFPRELPPEPRRSLRAALKELEQEKGDIEPLHEELSAYWRMRAGNYRLIFAYRNTPSERTIHCLFVERRAVVYQLFGAIARQVKP
jgi:mRNA-degrading endonuclease RelE of RelBE toxin-antitoxin system